MNCKLFQSHIDLNFGRKFFYQKISEFLEHDIIYNKISCNIMRVSVVWSRAPIQQMQPVHIHHHFFCPATEVRSRFGPQIRLRVGSGPKFSRNQGFLSASPQKLGPDFWVKSSSHIPRNSLPHSARQLFNADGRPCVWYSFSDNDERYLTT